MQSESSNQTLLQHALVWAGVFLASALLLAGTGLFEKIFIILIALWWASSLGTWGRGRAIK